MQNAQIVKVWQQRNAPAAMSQVKDSQFQDTKIPLSEDIHHPAVLIPRRSMQNRITKNQTKTKDSSSGLDGDNVNTSNVVARES
jgi:hypothetical protein